MSACLGNNSFPTSYKMVINNNNNNNNNNKEQGIVSILSSDYNPITSNNIPPKSPTSSNYSIRRTLSADMSSPKWLQQNGFQASMKRAQSSDQLNALGEEDTNDHDKIKQQDDSSSLNDDKGPAFEDIWSSILSQKKTDGSGPGSGSGGLPPPYVHPLVKRSTSSLSEKSLEICTESLGSETGSDGFSSYPSSEPEDEPQHELVDDNSSNISNNNNNNNVNVVDEEVITTKLGYEHNNYTSNKYCPSAPKRVLPRMTSFPPPLPSLAHRDGSNLQMRSHRQDGRLVLEAVCVPSQNCLRVQRQGGRLLLTLAKDDEDEEREMGAVEAEEREEEEEGEMIEDDQKDDKDEDEVEEEDDEDEEEEGNVVKELFVKRSPPSALVMSKLMGHIKSTWPRSFNATVVKTLEEEDEEETEEKQDTVATAKAQLPPRPKMARLSADNAYEYYWKRTTAAVTVLKPHSCGRGNGCGPQVAWKDANNNKLFMGHNGKVVGGQQGGVVVVKAAGVGRGEKGEYLVPLVRGCKEPRRSLLFWEPYCIATS